MVEVLLRALSRFNTPSSKCFRSFVEFCQSSYLYRSGLIVVTTASPKIFEFVKSRGADAVFDYHDPACGQKIHDYTEGQLRYVFDTIARPNTAAICARALRQNANDGEILYYTSSLPLESFPRDDVLKADVLAYTSAGEAFNKFGIDFPAMPEKYEFATRLWEMGSKLLSEGKLIPHPVEIRKGGLYGVQQG